MIYYIIYCLYIIFIYFILYILFIYFYIFYGYIYILYILWLICMCSLGYLFPSLFNHSSVKVHLDYLQFLAITHKTVLSTHIYFWWMCVFISLEQMPRGIVGSWDKYRFRYEKLPNWFPCILYCVFYILTSRISLLHFLYLVLDAITLFHFSHHNIRYTAIPHFFQFSSYDEWFEHHFDVPVAIFFSEFSFGSFLNCYFLLNFYYPSCILNFDTFSDM